MNSCFLKGERGLEKRDRRPPSWSILSQRIRWESLLWSQELPLPPEVLTGLVLRLPHHWADTHTPGGLQGGPSTGAACAFCDHTGPIGSCWCKVFLDKSCRKLSAGKQWVYLACKNIFLTELLLTQSPSCWHGRQMALVSRRCCCQHWDGQQWQPC